MFRRLLTVQVKVDRDNAEALLAHHYCMVLVAIKYMHRHGEASSTINHTTNGTLYVQPSWSLPIICA